MSQGKVLDELIMVKKQAQDRDWRSVNPKSTTHYLRDQEQCT